jgi:hypothetical protein
MNYIFLSAFIGKYIDCNNMHGMNNIKLAYVQQAKADYNYKNTKTTFYKPNAAIWFRKICTGSVVPTLTCLAYIPSFCNALKMAPWCQNM